MRYRENSRKTASNSYLSVQYKNRPLTNREEEVIMSKVWDKRRSMKQNLESLGLSADSNKSIKIDPTRYVLDKGWTFRSDSEPPELVVLYNKIRAEFH